VYAVANEGSRLEIPEGPLGKLIAGNVVYLARGWLRFSVILMGMDLVSALSHIKRRLKNYLLSLC
jgi:hypothetical protein